MSAGIIAIPVIEPDVVTTVEEQLHRNFDDVRMS